MTRTMAILKVLQRGRHADIAARVMRVFGASTLEECQSIYDSVGKAERSGLDDAVKSMTATAGAAFELSVDNEMA